MSTPDQARTSPHLTFRQTIVWSGSANAFAWPQIAVIAIWPWAIGLLAEALPGYELAINIHLYDLLNGILPAVVLIAARFLLRANHPSRYRVSVGRNLLIWLAAASFAVLGSLGVASTFGPVPLVYLQALPAGIVSSFGQILGFTLVSIIVTELSRTNLALARKQHALSITRSTLEQQVIDQRARLKAEVDVRISSQIADLEKQVAALEAGAAASESKALAERIKRVIDLVVRPLSHEVEYGSPSDGRGQIRTIREIQRKIRRLPIREQLRLRVSLGAIFNPTFTTGFMVLFVLPSYTFLFGWIGLLEVALPAAVITLSLILTVNRLARGARIIFILALGLAFLGAFFAAIPNVILGGLLLPRTEEGLEFFLALQVFLVCFTTFCAALFTETAFLALDKAKVANTELRKLVAYLTNEALITRRATAQLLHGKVQARLQAASIRLGKAEKVSQELLDDLSADLRGAVLDTTDTSLAESSVQTQLTELANNWEGICDLTFSITPDVESVIHVPPMVKSAVVEVIRESINNAVKHGEADEADIVITSTNPKQISVVIRNAVYASGTRHDGESGYGSVMFDQLTDDWSIEFADGDAIFRATIAIV
jgi:signal transduction histidine kinase